MAICKKCKQTSCGCSDTPLSTVPYSPSSTTCPSPQVCSEYTYSGCIIYDGPEFAEYNIIPGMNMNQVIQALSLITTDINCVTHTSPAPLITIVSVTNTTVDISWLAVSDIEDYTFSYSDDSGSTWTDVIVLDTILHYKLTGLDPDTEYWFRVGSNTASPEATCWSVPIVITTKSI
jgi:hypothetical protein